MKGTHFQETLAKLVKTWLLATKSLKSGTCAGWRCSGYGTADDAYVRVKTGSRPRFENPVKMDSVIAITASVCNDLVKVNCLPSVSTGS
jgi:hypothetical protein